MRRRTAAPFSRSSRNLIRQFFSNARRGSHNPNALGLAFWLLSKELCWSISKPKIGRIQCGIAIQTGQGSERDGGSRSGRGYLAQCRGHNHSSVHKKPTFDFGSRIFLVKTSLEMRFISFVSSKGKDNLPATTTTTPFTCSQSQLLAK
jgi:hypothetical protein